MFSSISCDFYLKFILSACRGDSLFNWSFMRKMWIKRDLKLALSINNIFNDKF